MRSAGFHDLIGGATVMKVGKLQVPVVAIEDLMRLKQAAGRPKDRVELEILGALKQERERGGRV